MIVWSSVREFFAMGGYGLYVWGAFGCCAVAVVAETALLAARRRGLQNGGDEAARPAYKGARHEAQG